MDARSVGIHILSSRLLEPHLIPVLGSQRAAEQIAAAYSSPSNMTQKAARSWENILTNAEVLNLNADLVESNLGPAELQHGWNRNVDLLVLSDAQFDALGINADQLVCQRVLNGLEISRISGIGQAQAVRRWLRQPSAVDVGTVKHEVEARMTPVLRGSNEITVFDRYAFRQLTDPARSLSAAAWIDWIVEIATTLAPDAPLIFYASWKTAEQRDSLFPAVRKFAITAALRVDRQSAIVLVGAKDGGGCGPFEHDRHLRAGRRGFALSSGFDRLFSARSQHRWQLHYQWLDEDVSHLRAAELAVESRASAARWNIWPTRDGELDAEP